MRVLAVTNMYPTPERPASGAFVEGQVAGLREAGVDVDVFLVDRHGQGPFVYLGLGRSLAGRFRSHPYDLVHVMYGGVMAEQVTSFRLRPTVVSFCGSDLLGEPCNGVFRKLCAAWGVRASLRAARQADGIVVKSQNLLEALPVRTRVKARVIPNGVDLETFREMNREECRRRLGLPFKTFLALFPANSGDLVKRPELAESSVKRLRELGVEAELIRLENVPHCEVPSLLNACDVLLLTSLHEGSPNVVKEALACNIPIVSVEVGDVSERISGVEGCYICKAGPEELAAHLRRVFEGPRRINGRTSVVDLTLDCVARRLHQFYGEVLAGWERDVSDVERG